MCVFRNHLEVERHEADRDEGHQDQRDLQVGIHHQGRSVELDELALAPSSVLG
jgi:hypothetical protein